MRMTFTNDNNSGILPENPPGINTAVGLQMCNGNCSLYLKMLHIFNKTKRNEDKNIRKLLSTGDRDTAYRSAHSMKSVAGSLGAIDLSDAARLLEEAITNDSNDQLEVRLNNYSDALSKVIDGLDSAFGCQESMSEVRRATAPDPATQEGKTINTTRSGETILLAEDDRIQMKLTTNILESNGYKVLQAVDGVEAVELFKKHQEQIDLVIMDVLMPKMTGKHAWDEIRSIRPDVRACFISGYTNDIMGGKLAVDFSLPFISKPIIPAILLRTVREILDSALK